MLSPELAPPASIHTNADRTARTEEEISPSLNAHQQHLPSRAVDRRTRRYKQIAREEESAQRKRDGKKPFYLTLDSTGKPYGPGRPAWITEIGKLAVGLDPSCTHISRQTFEDVTTMKARLNERFEYSGPLNEDYLKTMMGRAVTTKRSDLIKKIKKGEP